MIFIQFILTLIGMIVLIPLLFYLRWLLSIFFKTNILTRQGHIYTIICFYDLDEEPNLRKNLEFQRTGAWEYSPEGHYWKGFSKLSKEALQKKLMADYGLSPAQVIVTVPEEMKMASAQTF